MDRRIPSLRSVLLAASAVLVLVHQITIHLGYRHWMLDVWSHFQLQILVVAVPIAVGTSIVTRSKPYAVLSTCYLFLLAVWVFGGTNWSSSDVHVERNIDLYYQNVQYDSDPASQQDFAERIVDYGASVVALVEPSPALVRAVSLLRGEEPLIYQHLGNRSCVVFGPEADVLDRFVVRADDHDPMCVVRFTSYDLYVAHPLPPLGSNRYARQDRFFAMQSEYIEESVAAGRDWLVVGDFNSTKYSSLFRRYFGAYVTAQYYSWASFGLLMIPIDHAFGSLQHRGYLYPAYVSDHHGIGITFTD